MRAASLSIAAVAALVCIYLFVTYQFPSLPFGTVLIVVFLAGFAGAVIAGYWLRRRRLQTWASTSGRIESCRLGKMDEGTQEYYCTYMFSVDDVRQSGEVMIFDKGNRFEEIQAALLGQQVTVRYDPSDCAESIVEETEISGWKLVS